MKTRFGRESFYVLDDKHVGIVANDISNINKNNLAERLSSPVAERLDAIETFSTFNKELRGHLIKYIVGIVQEFGALTYQEISTLLMAVEVDKDVPEVEQLCLCAKVMGWVDIVGKGIKDLVVAIVSTPAAEYKIAGKKLERNTVRRRSDILSYWKANDNDRFLAIIDARAS